MKRIICLAIFFSGLNATYSKNELSVPPIGGGNCCCGQFVELNYPNLDFEEPPNPPPGGLITFYLGDVFGGWTVTRANIDLKDAYFGNLSAGNPNGRSNFVDLHGSPGFGAIEYQLTGLTPGNTYRIDFWTAQNGSGYTSTGTLKIAGGAWLTGNWTVDTDGSVYWFKVTFMFVAKASSAGMEFSSVGPNEWGGTLIDDIKIFECPSDTEEPTVNNPPEDYSVECDSEIPKVPKLNIADNCDPSPTVSYKETTDIIDPCTKVITRTWQITDACGNVHNEDQQIRVEDKTPPSFTKMPQNKTVTCSSDVQLEFKDWIKKNGNAVATDACGAVTWRTTIEHDPHKSCDTVLVEFIAIDHCGQESSELATFYVIDTLPPKISKPAENKSYFCLPSAKDSLRPWLNNHGYADAKDGCDTAIWSNNFNGDTTSNNIRVWFYVKDRCGNTDSTMASFIRRSSSDTFRVNINSCTIPVSKADTMLYSINGCDSIVIVNSTRIPSDTVLLKINTCDVNHAKYDSILLTNSFGCDSLVVSEYIIHPVQYTTISDSSCFIQSEYADTLSFVGQYCDSIVIMQHYPLRNDSIFIHNVSCDSTQRGTIIRPLKNKFGCDSIVSTTTDYSAMAVTNLTSKECGLKKSYVDTIQYSTTLCDSIVITTHLPQRTDSTFMQAHTCDPAKAGMFTSRLTNNVGCDSIILIDRILDRSDSIHVDSFSCNSGNVGKIKNVFQNQSGCDSIVETETHLLPGDSITIQQFTCKIIEAGISKIILKNKSGCDSSIITKTIFTPSDTTYTNGTTCILNQQRKDTTIIHTTHCDSLIIQTISFIPSDTSFQSVNTCLKAEAGLDSILLQNRQGCDSLIYVNKLYVPLELKFSLDSISCFNKNDGAVQVLNDTDFSKPYDLILNNQILNNTRAVSNLGEGTYSLFIRDQKGCITDTLFFAFQNPPELITELGNDLEVKQGSSIELNLQSNRNLKQINWLPASITNCTSCTKVDFVVDRDTWIYTIAIDDHNCESRDSLFIRVKKSGFVYAPNAISPNGDNINDFFYLIADDGALIELMQIFDRWGNMVFETKNILPNNPELGWNGSFNSQKMNPGVYVYYAKVKLGDGNEQMVKGDFSLIR